MSHFYDSSPLMLYALKWRRLSWAPAQSVMKVTSNHNINNHVTEKLQLFIPCAASVSHKLPSSSSRVNFAIIDVTSVQSGFQSGFRQDHTGAPRSAQAVVTVGLA